MKLYSREHLVKVLNKNLNFETCEDETLGPVIVMDNFDAYKYAVITGHGYLDINEPELRVIFKRDMYRVFNQVFQYEIQFGIFNTPNVELFSTTKKHIEHYPFIVEGDYKKLIFVDYEDKIIDCEPMLYNKLKKIANYVNGNGEKSQDYIICPIRKGKLVDFEPFFEYVVSEIYNRNGYITDTQIPFFYGVGTPDLAVYDFKDIIKHIQKYIDVTGFSIFELMMYLSTENCTIFQSKTGPVEIKKLIALF
ncbi:MAG: hypothetical protein WBL14_09310 [Caldicoprobacterales bacterium]